MTADYEGIRGHRHAIEQVIPLLEAIRAVAEVAFRRAEAGLPSLTRYAARIDAQLADLNELADGMLTSPEAPVQRSVLVVISSERGLCGAFNQRLVEQVRRELERRRSASEEVILVCLGSRGRRLLEAAGEHVALAIRLTSFSLPSYLVIERAAVDILDLMEETSCARLTVMHNAPRRRFGYEVVQRELFPVELAAQAADRPARPPEMKPAEDVEELFAHLVTERMLTDLYEAVVESAVSEELARVAAMRLATDNARHLLEQLSLEANRARQASETNALLEIIGGFQAASSNKNV